MSEPAKQPEPWTKPELVRLGTVKDVAGSGGAGAQSPVQDRS